MEPLSISLILAGLAGAASKKIIDEVWDQGKKWISNYFKDHGEKIRENAEKNALSFLSDLAQRIQLIEENIKDSEKARKVFEEKLNSPDFAASLQSAIISSARTSSEYKHKILSRTISEKLKTKESENNSSCLKEL